MLPKTWKTHSRIYCGRNQSLRWELASNTQIGARTLAHTHEHAGAAFIITTEVIECIPGTNCDALAPARIEAGLGLTGRAKQTSSGTPTQIMCLLRLVHKWCSLDNVLAPRAQDPGPGELLNTSSH